MARFLAEAMATSAPYSHETTQPPSQPTHAILAHSHPEDHTPAQTVASRSKYQDHSLSNKIQMALTAQARGPSYVSKNSMLWGYAKKVAKQTISDWQKALPHLMALASGAVVPRVYKAPHHRAVKQEAKDEVLRDVALSAANGEETTTEAVCDMFAAQGVTPSASFVRSFLHHNNQSLHTVIPRSSFEIDDSKQVEEQIRALWAEVQSLSLPWSNWVSFDEKPLFLERFRRRVWRPVAMPAFVRTFNKTRQRETVIFPTCADGRKLPIIFLFHGTKQLKVKVPIGCPCLVLFTKTAMISGDAFMHILERAIFPNLPSEPHGILLDEHPTHSLEAVVALLSQHNTQAVKIVHPLTKYSSFMSTVRASSCDV